MAQGACSHCGCGYGCAHQAPPPISQPRSFTAEEWEQWNQTPEGSAQYHWWADWIPTHEGQVWCYNKRIEARCVVDGMIRKWGLDALQWGRGDRPRLRLRRQAGPLDGLLPAGSEQLQPCT